MTLNMENIDLLFRKFTLRFPNIPLPTLHLETDKYIVNIFGTTVCVDHLGEIHDLIDAIVNMCTNKQEIQLTNINIPTTNKRKVENNLKSVKNELNKPLPLQISVKKAKQLDDNLSNKQSVKGKMQIKNILSNTYIPSFKEDMMTSKGNILVEFKESFSAKITEFCNEENVTYPEYLFEKSNGVYICRAEFMNEKFESRYAYDRNVAKEDACNLIWAFINYRGTKQMNKSGDRKRIIIYRP